MEIKTSTPIEELTDKPSGIRQYTEVGKKDDYDEFGEEEGHDEWGDEDSFNWEDFIPRCGIFLDPQQPLQPRAVVAANRKWKKGYGQAVVSREKIARVSFHEHVAVDFVTGDPELHIAYAEARRGEWIIAARNRKMFERRIQRLSTIIDPLLSKEHRERVFAERHSVCNVIK